MLRPSRAFLLLGALLCATLPFADRLTDVGLAGFLKSFRGDERIWTTAGRLSFFLVMGVTAALPTTRAGAGWIFAGVVLYVGATLLCFLSVFSAREPLFGDHLRGPAAFLLMLPVAGGFHLVSLVLRDFPWWLVGFWARVELDALILLAGALHAFASERLVGGGLALAAGVLLIVGEVLARREEAFDEDAVDETAGPFRPPRDP